MRFADTWVGEAAFRSMKTPYVNSIMLQMPSYREEKGEGSSRKSKVGNLKS